jgi:glycosyltransferase involved in cell wall biosynthesis
MAGGAPIALIVTSFNNEDLIGQCLDSAPFCGEKIVVDSLSTDRTSEIARSHGARVIERPWAGYVAQKQFALEQATAPWVLLLDSDEQATHALGAEIEAAIASPAPADGYRIRRVLYHLGHYFTGSLYRDYPIRLFRRERAHIGGVDPHDKVVVAGRVAGLRAPILHFSYKDVADHVASINRLTSRAAQEAEPGPLTALRMVTHPAWRFFNFYCLRGGFRAGGRGLYAASTAAFYVFLKYAKLYERRLEARRVR